MVASSVLGVKIDSRTSVYPETPSERPDVVETPLSIADCNSAFLPAPSIVWIYDLEALGAQRECFEASTLECSLRKILNAYRFWTGRVSETTLGSRTSNVEGRLSLVYNSAHDNGVDFIIASSSNWISQIIHKDQGASYTRIRYPPGGLIPSGMKIAQDLIRDPGVHLVNIQVTYFRDAVAIGIKAPHFIADATALSQFVRNWGFVNGSMRSTTKPNDTLSVIFAPQLLDEKILGSSTFEKSGSELSRRCREIQPTRYDSYGSHEDCPPELRSMTRPLSKATENEKAHQTPVASRIPWEEHNTSPSTLRHIVHFTRRELEAIARSTMDPSRPAKIGSITLLMAHVWKCIIRARVSKLHPNEVHHLGIAVGLRGRLSLPASLVGSPVIIANTSTSASSVSQITPSTIKSVLSRIDFAGAQAVLYNKMHEDSQRMWSSLLGRKHTCISSWIGTDLYSVDFTGTGACPLFAGSAENLPDGMIILVEPRPSAQVHGGLRYDKNDGIDVVLYCDDEEALRRFHADPELKPKQLPSSRL